MHKNIVLIVADTLRAKNMGLYGYDKDTAPFLTKKAREDVYLDPFYANSPWTVPAHASVFSGELPSEHGTTTEKTYFEGNNDLLDYVEERGFYTAGISENQLISPELGFGKDFAYFEAPTPSVIGKGGYGRRLGRRMPVSKIDLKNISSFSKK